MKTKLFFLALLTLAVASCTKTDVESQSEKRILNITASIENTSDSRGVLEEFGDGEVKNLRYKWVVNDIIQFAFEQGNTVVKADGKVTKVYEPGNRADFSVEIPAGITEDFTLYAYVARKSYSSGTLKRDEPTVAILPNASSEYDATLSGQNVALWCKTNVKYDGKNMPKVGLSFKHLGSILTLKVKNIHEFLPIGPETAAGFRLSGNYNWVYNVEDNGAATWDMKNERFVDSKQANYMEGKHTTELAGDAVATYHIWFVPGIYNKNNEIRISVLETMSYREMGVSSGKPAHDFKVGRNYVVYAKVNSETWEISWSNANWE